MNWRLCLACSLLGVCLLPVVVQGAQINGHYMEARTCQVYTGPCFANAEVGLTGKDAIMAWQITDGKHNGVDLSGLNVVVVVKATRTLGFAGLDDCDNLQSMIVVDEDANELQRAALVEFAKKSAGQAGKKVKSIRTAPIKMELNTAELRGKLQAGECVQLETRQARPGDCICSNESAYYPPLAKLESFVPGVTIRGGVNRSSLGRSWSIPDSRSAYMATFAY